MADKEVNNLRRNLLIATGAYGGIGVVGAAVPFVGSWNPSAKALAAGAPIKIDISKLQEGEILGPMQSWRDRPIFVVKLSEAMLEKLNSKNERLADPDSTEPQQPAYAANETRSIKKNIVVLVGLCTHLNCSPKFKPLIQPESFDSEWMGGFYCPCHGSKFDLAGRVYTSVPAPSNLKVPQHYYESENVLVIGKDEGTA